MSQKSENLLNLALEATEEERMKSLELEVGYHPIEKEWDLIVKYSGSLSEIRKTAVSVTELMNGYAVLTIEEKQIENLARFPEIEFIEKPKRLFFEAENGRRVSCIDSVQRPPLSLSGRGVLVGIIDSGIDYTNPNFCNADGTTRIRALWDQSIQGKPPAGYALGTEYTQEQINMALAQEGSIESKKEIVPSSDTSGHGTAVAGVAAGNGRGSEGMRYRGVAYESELIVVKLGNARTDGFPRTTELMQAVDYVIRKALEYRMPVAVNISFGNTYGSHDGTTLLERFIDAASDVWKNVICVGSGNEGNSAGHTWGRMNEEEEAEVQLGVQMNEPALNLQIWKSYVDEIEISVVSPSGVHAGPFKEILGAQRFVIGGTELLVYYGEPKPFSVRQEIFIDFLPRETYIESGVWKILLEPQKITEGIYQMWLPSENVLNRGTAFLKPSAEMTLTIPSTASRVVTVAAYDALTFSYADFSGRGLTAYNTGEMQKPDLAAPGVNVTAPSGTGYGKFSGTSFAVPFASGSAALMMEWGIVKKNDPYLYGEKVKAYLRRGARKLPGYDRWPNPQLGYGTLCLEESIPRQ
ncbi:MAG: S8 family serine peptidase [Clostridiales bacterium]|nr:S8 family serine peptidase [Clostridiales bacterium]